MSGGSRRDGACGLLLALATWGLYFCVIWPGMLFEQADGLYAGWRTVWADWAAHFAYANVFAYWPVELWFSGHPLSATTGFDYPFLADAVSGLLMRAGLGRVWSFVLPSILTSLALVVLLFSFYGLALRSSLRALVASTLFFANGGLGFLAFANDLVAQGSLQPLLAPVREYTYMPAHHIEWINLVSSELLPQRGFLLGLPLALLVLIAIRRHVTTGFRRASLPGMVALGLLAGLLSIVHVHSLLAVVVVCAFSAIFDRGHLRAWAAFAAAAALPSLLAFGLLYEDVAGRGFLAWQPGWLANPAEGEGISLPLFLWLNWGVFLPMAAMSILRFRGHRDPLVLAGLGLFVVCFLVRFQPNAWDNTKLLTWSHLLLCVPVARYLGLLWSRGRWLRAFAALLFLLATASGFLDLWRVARTEHVAHRMWSTEELELAAAFRELSSPESVVLCSDHHHHWVPSLSGRRVLLGYRGWLGSYGIDYAPIEREVRTMLAGGPEAEELMLRRGVDFVVIGDTERRDYEAAEGYFERHHERVLNGAGFNVYLVNRKGGAQ